MITSRLKMPGELSEDEWRIITLYGNLERWYDGLDPDWRRVADYWLATGDRRLGCAIVAQLLSEQVGDRAHVASAVGIEQPLLAL